MDTTAKSYLKRANKIGDTVVLILTILFSVAVVLKFSEISYEIVLSASAILLLTLFYVRLWQVSFLANALRVQNGTHSYMNDMANEICSLLNAPPVDIYITQNPFLNAFAIGYTRPFTIVLNSATVDELSRDEMKAVLIHEIGHIKYRHTIITSYISPLETLVPVIGPIVGWVFGFWHRRAEKTCDRLATIVTNDPHTVIMALIKVHVGSEFAQYMKEEGVIYQDLRGRGLMRKIAQTLQSHPFLVTRVSEIINFAKKENLPLPEEVVDYINQTATTG